MGFSSEYIFGGYTLGDIYNMLLGHGDGCGRGLPAGTINMEYISGDIMLYEWVNGYIYI